MQRFLGGFQTAGGVQARRELESDFVSAELDLRCWATFFNATNSGALRCVQAVQSGGNQNAVFADERNDVRDGAQRDQVEQRAQIEIRRAGQADFAAALDQRVGEFEGEAGGAKFGEICESSAF